MLVGTGLGAERHAALPHVLEERLEGGEDTRRGDLHDRVPGVAGVHRQQDPAPVDDQHVHRQRRDGAHRAARFGAAGGAAERGGVGADAVGVDGAVGHFSVVDLGGEGRGQFQPFRVADAAGDEGEPFGLHVAGELPEPVGHRLPAGDVDAARLHAAGVAVGEVREEVEDGGPVLLELPDPVLDPGDLPEQQGLQADVRVDEAAAALPLRQEQVHLLQSLDGGAHLARGQGELLGEVVDTLRTAADQASVHGRGEVVEP
ncbi:hypothetical protein ACWGDD_23640 [Streptomyces sp. NPDC055011]